MAPHLPRLPQQEVEDRLRRAKADFEESLSRLREEFDSVQQQARDLASLYGGRRGDLEEVQRAAPKDPSASPCASFACAKIASKLGDEMHVRPMLEDDMVVAEIDTCTTGALDMSENVVDIVLCREEAEAIRKMQMQSSATGGRTEAELERFDRRTAWLNIVPAIVIVANALVIGVSLDVYRGHIGWQVLEYVFVAFYTFEFAVKVWIYGWSWYWCGPERAWNIFDILCLAVMYVDVSFATILLTQGRDSSDAEAISSLNLMKVFRLARLARLIRALRFQVFHELKLIVLGVFSGLRVICWAIVLLVVLVYGIGIAMRNFVGDGPEGFPEFETVVAAMFTCFRCFTDGCSAYDGTPLSEHLRRAHGGPFIVGYIFVTMLVTVGVFNLIMAVFIENVMSSQFVRKQTEIAETALVMETKIKDRIIRKLGLKRSSFRASPDLKTRSEGLDEVLQVAGRSISRDEFDSWLHDQDFVRVLDEASIDTSAQVGLFDVLDADGGGELSVNELVTGLMSLRGPVTKGDVIGMSLKIRYLVSMMEASQQPSFGV
ncbi:Cacna1c [Symbiodinium natans]|uniref:Cacna1c protein n=1 Tax=Symbiodinium natans TaxID=878477 RepID=A0A812MP81_9DINO|nr:Cacna1c [Symbiodinium natans]